VNPEQDPFVKHLTELSTAVLKGSGTRVNAIAFRDLPIVASVIGQDLVLCMAERRLDVLKYHMVTPPYLRLRAVLTFDYTVNINYITRKAFAMNVSFWLRRAFWGS